jgi:acetolactate synthase I/III small subunit
MLTTFAVYVDDAPGVLNRVASLFRRRAFNIVSLTVGHTDQPGESRMTIVVEEDLPPERIAANLYKLIDVRRVEVLAARSSVSRDLAMIKVATSVANRSDVMQIVHVFRARVVDVAPDSLIVEITGGEDKVDGLVEVLRPYGILEMVRTGCVAMSRGLSAFQSSRVPGLQGSEVPGFQGSEVPEFQNSKVPGFQDSADSESDDGISYSV